MHFNLRDEYLNSTAFLRVVRFFVADDGVLLCLKH